MEQRPKQDISWMAATLLVIFTFLLFPMVYVSDASLNFRKYNIILFQKIKDVFFQFVTII